MTLKNDIKLLSYLIKFDQLIFLFIVIGMKERNYFLGRVI